MTPTTPAALYTWRLPLALAAIVFASELITLTWPRFVYRHLAGVVFELEVVLARIGWPDDCLTIGVYGTGMGCGLLVGLMADFALPCLGRFRGIKFAAVGVAMVVFIQFAVQVLAG